MTTYARMGPNKHQGMCAFSTTASEEHEEQPGENPWTQLGPELPADPPGTGPGDLAPATSPAASPLRWHTCGPQPASPFHLLTFGVQSGEGCVRQVLDLQKSTFVDPPFRQEVTFKWG